jgi:hypothetical protein
MILVSEDNVNSQINLDQCLENQLLISWSQTTTTTKDFPIVLKQSHKSVYAAFFLLRRR